MSENIEKNSPVMGIDPEDVAPLEEPERQYYFIEKAKSLYEAKCSEAGRRLSFCVTTFGCQMNVVSTI